MQERHATWLELLYDLIFAAAISQLAIGLGARYNLRGFLDFAVLFIPVWWAWVGQTFYLTRFDTDDTGHRLLTMAQIIAVAFLAVNIPGALSITTIGFALSYAAVRFILVFEYIRAALYIPSVRPLINRYIAGFGTAATLWAVSTLVPTPYRFGLWIIAVVVDFMAPLTAGRLHAELPPHLAHLPERFGQFTIIVIGEAILSVVIGIEVSGLKISSGVAGILGLLIAFTLWWGYFEGVKGAETRVLQSMQDVVRYQEWLYSHLPLVMAIASVAVGISHIIPLGFQEILPVQQALILSFSLGVSMLALSTLFLSAYPSHAGTSIHRLAIPHYIIAFLTIGIGALGAFLAGIIILAILTFLGILQVAYSIRVIKATTGYRQE
jgi:low temperature requirement protein LtrA